MVDAHLPTTDGRYLVLPRFYSQVLGVNA